jgi:hypothetical protein
VVSSRAIRAVPAGTGELVCAAAIVLMQEHASNRMQGRTVHFFMTPPQMLQPQNLPLVALTLDQTDGRDNMRLGQ